MRLFCVLLFALLTFSEAMPYRPGARLGYLVIRPEWREPVGEVPCSSFTSLTVLDTNTNEWGDIRARVAVRDSAIGRSSIRMDTLILLAKRADSGLIQRWDSVGNCLAAWEPSSIRETWPEYQKDREHWFWDSDGAGSFQWGAVGFACSKSSLAMYHSYSIDPFGLRQASIFEASASAPLPRGVWARDTGMIRYHDTLLREDWSLRTIDGVPLPGGERPLSRSVLNVQPRPGVTWLWEAQDNLRWVFDDTARHYFVRWSIDDALPDSAGWFRWKILQEYMPDRGERTSIAGLVRINLEKDSVHVDPGLAHELAWGFVIPWYAMPGDSSSFVSTATSPSGYLGCSREGPDCLAGRTVRSGVGMDLLSMYQQRGDRYSIYPGAFKLTTFRLLSHNDQLIRVPAGVTARASDPRRILIRSARDVLELLRERPASLLRLSDVAGRSWDLPGATAGSELVRLHGVFFIEMEAAGLHATGKVLLP